MRLHTSLLLVVSATLLQSASAADKVSFIPQWEPGKTYRQEVTIISQATVPSQAESQDSNVIQQIKTTVTKDAGSDRRLAEVTFESVKALVTTGKEVVTYDSSDPAMSRPHLQQAFGAMVGRSFTLVYDKDGKFLEMRVPDPDGGLSPVGDFKGPTNKQFADAWQKSVELALPKQSLAVGDNYDHESKAEMQPLGVMTTKTKGRFEAMVDVEGRRHAKLLLDGKLDLGAGGALAALAEGGRLTGEILFDIERRVVTSSSIRTEMKMPPNFGGMTLNTTVNTKLKSVESTK